MTDPRNETTLNKRNAIEELKGKLIAFLAAHQDLSDAWLDYEQAGGCMHGENQYPFSESFADIRVRTWVADFTSDLNQELTLHEE